MSLELLGKHWEGIKTKVIKPLWQYRYKELFKNIKLDYDDFESLAGEELTKAFVKYNPEESNVFTYSQMVLNKKAKTYIRDMKREKRIIDTVATSIYNTIGDSDTLYEDFIEDISETQNFDNKIDEEIMIVVNKMLKPKEVKIINMSITGFDDRNIANSLNTTVKDINALRKRLSDDSSFIRALRIAMCKYEEE